MAKRKRDEDQGVPEWMVTYGDLMSLLLTFFILLASFSELKQPREYRKIIEKIKESLGLDGGLGQLDIPDSATNSTMSILPEQAKRGQDALFINKQNEDNVVGRHDKVSVVHDGDYFAKGGTVRFPPGGAELGADDEKMLLRSVAPELRGRRNIARIVAHAWGREDAQAGGAGDGGSEGLMRIAMARALAVQDVLVREGGVDPRILRIELAADREPAKVPGYGDSGGAQNRRVQVYLTDRMIEEVHPDPLGTGRGRDDP